MEANIKQQLAQIEKDYQEVSDELVDPQILTQQDKLKNLLKKQKKFQKVLDKYERYKELEQTIQENQDILAQESDADLIALASAELSEQTIEKSEIEKEIKKILMEDDDQSSLNEKDVIVEIRAGTGGDEASLFATDLFALYTNYAKQKNWKINVLSQSQNEVGGYKEIVFEMNGEDVYGNMKYESGVHRVQRIPKTEKMGRIHTSTVTIAVLPQAEETDIEIRPEDLRIDTYRSSGAGGQHVNVTDSAVRITYLPDNVAVECQDERSQHKNKAKALQILRSKILAEKAEKQQAELAKERKTQIGTGERAEKIRTYNWPQDRITDHRIKKNWHGIDKIISEGNLDKIVNDIKESLKKTVE